MSDQLQDTLTQEKPQTQEPTSATALAEALEAQAPEARETQAEETQAEVAQEAQAEEAQEAQAEASEAAEDAQAEAAQEAQAEAAQEAQAEAAQEAQAEVSEAAQDAQTEASQEAQAEEAQEAQAGEAQAQEARAEEAREAEEAPEARTTDAEELPELPLDLANQTPEMLALYDAQLKKRAVDGQVIGWNKGGYHVAIGRVAAFCPVSQIEIGNPRSPKRYLDKTFKFHVIEIQKGGRRVVVSRSEALKAERAAIAAEVRARLKPGMVCEGRINSITDFGAFVDLGGSIEGLVHVSEISRKRVEHPKEVLKVGQEVKVTVLKIEKGGQRISLSMKRLEGDPWSGIKDRFSPGDTFNGKILRQTDFGFFVEVQPGLEGLVHKSRLPHGTSSEDESLAVGETVEGWIHEVDARRRRLSLSLRPVAKGNPWHGIEERFPEGSVIKGKVERLASFGAFIEIEPGLTGLLPFSALGGSPANPRKQYHPGKEVSVRVLSIDRDKRRISLGTEASKAEGSQTDYREYKKRQGKTSGGLNVMAAAFEKLKQRQADA